ncbi:MULTISPECIES: hypothetical protein [unclassified Micromonospora]|uniref:hypothetical protein n=1 Tax=unclassified Micromonospora TaxID=2617518 RepID=UPI00362F4231
MVVRHLLARVADGSPDVRLTVLAVLADLCPQEGLWPAAADAAAVALGDPDERVRRAAAWLFVAAAGADEGTLLLFGSSDPVLRTALAEALWLRMLQRGDHGHRWVDLVDRMRRDDHPAVRFLGACAGLLTADPTDWPRLDAAVRWDLAPAAEALGGEGGWISWRAGEWWAIVLRRRDREQDAYAAVAQLVRAGEEEGVRQSGLAIAAEAMRTWRAAPDRLAPVLSAVFTQRASAVRTEAVGVVCASLTATRLVADQLTRMLVEPAVSAEVAVARGCVGDSRAVPELLRLLGADDPPSRLGDALATVAAVSPDPAGLVQAARQVLAGHPEPCREEPHWHRCPARVAVRLLSALGPHAADAVPDLAARLADAMQRGVLPEARPVVGTLAAIGAAAAPAVPLLRRYAVSSDAAADLAVRALLTITGDRRIADDYLDARPARPRRCRIAPDLFDWLAQHGGLTDRQVRQLNHLFTQRGRMQASSAIAYWRHHGPPAAPTLLSTLPQYLDDDAFAPPAMKALAAMGPHARPVIPVLDRLITSRHRAAVYLGDADAEMRADEHLLQHALATRAQITAAPI